MYRQKYLNWVKLNILSHHSLIVSVPERHNPCVQRFCSYDTVADHIFRISSPTLGSTNNIFLSKMAVDLFNSSSPFSQQLVSFPQDAKSTVIILRPYLSRRKQRSWKSCFRSPEFSRKDHLNLLHLPLLLVPHHALEQSDNGAWYLGMYQEVFKMKTATIPNENIV